LTAIVREAAPADVKHILAIDPIVEADQRREAEITGAVGKGECLVAVEQGVIVWLCDFPDGFFRLWFCLAVSGFH
jgi:hypothetical protein